MIVPAFANFSHMHSAKTDRKHAFANWTFMISRDITGCTFVLHGVDWISKRPQAQIYWIRPSGHCTNSHFRLCRVKGGQFWAWQSATLLPISCKSVQLFPAREEEPVSSVRQSSSGGATNTPGKVGCQNWHCQCVFRPRRRTQPTRVKGGGLSCWSDFWKVFAWKVLWFGRVRFPRAL